MGNIKKEKWVFPLSVPKKGLKGFLKYITGKLLLTLKPQLAKDFLNGIHPKSKLERHALASLVSDMNNAGNQNDLALLHRKLWESNDAHQFYETTDSRFNKSFSDVKVNFDQIFKKFVSESELENVVEIGCGSGKILEHLSQTRGEFKRYVGLDINASQIKVNKNTFKDNPKFEFYSGDANTWIKENHSPKSVYLTFGGVLEYFTEKEIQDLFKTICSTKDSALFVYEPLAKEFDPKENRCSMVYGSELSFSHAYTFLAESSGMKIIFEKRNIIGNTQWVLLGAMHQD